MSILNRLFKPRERLQNSFLGSAYTFFFGSTTSGKYRSWHSLSLS